MHVHINDFSMEDNFHNLLFLDVEATGLEADDCLVQVAYRYNGEEKESLFRPDKEMSVEAMEVTHITNAHLADKKPFQGSDMYSELKQVLHDDDTVFVAHNAAYDKSMIEREGLRVNKMIDTLKIAQHLDTRGDIPAYRLQYLRYYLGIEIDDAAAHDALGDVRVLVALFARMYEKMAQKHTHDEIIARMIDISQKPILLKRIAFGKYKGSFFADIARSDRGYLEWLLQQKEEEAANGVVNEDALHTLKHYLR